MRIISKYLSIASIVFSLACLFDALFWPSQYSFVLDNLLFPFAFLNLAICFFYRKELRVLILIFIILFFWGLTSEFLNQGSIALNPFYHLLRWLKWPIIFSSFAIGANTFLKKDTAEQLLKAIFVTLVGLNLFMLINPFGIGETLQFVYSPKGKALYAYYNELGVYRLTGTLLNPNSNASIFGLFFIYFIFSDIDRKWKYLIASAIIILLTQSRTVLLGLLLTFGMFFIVQVAQYPKKSWKLITAVLLGLICFFLFFGSSNLESLLTGQAFLNHSWISRLDNYKLFIELPLFSQLIGLGVIENQIKEYGVYFDSEYLGVLMQMGIVGMLLWLGFICYCLVITIRSKLNWFWIISLLFTMIISLTNYSFNNPAYATLLFFLLGITSTLGADNFNNPTNIKSEK